MWTQAWDLMISCVLVLISGFVSGMTVGMLSIDSVQLKVLQDQGTLEERRKAMKLAQILSNHHLILVTLLLANSIALEALPIFLNKCVSEVVAVAMSVTLILLFGEIIPQAACTGKHQMKIVMSSLPVVQLLISTLWVLAYPIARLLDFLVGESEGQPLYARSHLKALIRLHQKNSHSEECSVRHHSVNSNGGSALCADEVVVIEGALDLASKCAQQVMVPIDDVFMLEETQPLTVALRQDLLARGHSRVPVYRTHKWNVKGLLYVKSLICIDSHETPQVGHLVKCTKAPIFCHPQTSLYDLLNEFQRGRHMAFVTQNPLWHIHNWGRETNEDIDASAAEDDRALVGITTIEDIIEELIQEEIYDEFDNYASSYNNELLSPASPAPVCKAGRLPTIASGTFVSSGGSPLAGAIPDKPLTGGSLTGGSRTALVQSGTAALVGSTTAAGPVKVTIQRKSFTGLDDLNERLLETSRGDARPPQSVGANPSGGVVVVNNLKNLKTIIGLNQAKRKRQDLGESGVVGVDGNVPAVPPAAVPAIGNAVLMMGVPRPPFGPTELRPATATSHQPTTPAAEPGLEPATDADRVTVDVRD
ncbi:putative transmembrane protein [Gregarina niphandrodes]|uniref:Transmembrane protein n=1 Tax=Gregarina niphandrodes TaxID=110365 RepID=A0A023B3Y0_GRENI|nr:putative transmembrane protein [Gregarina niphandrodes]EZG56066.1 putative transmembrane protein [Gregarina niphandrodes]|eukprot:XP_011131355.1 putative transmembrane protein [Gregarina niphandrodes]